MSDRALIITGDFVEDYEIMVTYQLLKFAEYEVDVVSPGKVEGDYVATAIHDFGGYQTFTESIGHRFQLTAAFDNVLVRRYRALLLPGGRAPEHLQLNPEVLAIVRAFSEESLGVAAICHGVQVLAAAGILTDRRCTGYPGIQPQVEAVGGLWCPPAADLTTTCVDGRLITAASWPALATWVRLLLDAIVRPDQGNPSLAGR